MQPNPDHTPGGPVRILRNGTVVLPDRTLCADLMIQDHLILALAPAGCGQIPRAEQRRGEIWDVDGYRITPGFIDTHTHGGWGVDFYRDGRERFAEAADAYAAVGVTRLLITLHPGPFDEMLDRVREAALACVEHEAFLGIHLEGPFLSADRRGALPSEGILDYTEPRMGQILEAAAGQLRVMTFAPEAVDPRYLPGIRSAGVRPSIGHTCATQAQTEAAIAAGAWRATHLCNAMPTLHHRQPGPMLPLLRDPRVFVELILDGEHIDDAMLAFLIETRGAERVIAVSDSMPLAGTGPGSGEFCGSPVTSDGCRAVQNDGTLAGSVTPLTTALWRTEHELGLAPADLCQMGATVPATHLDLPRLGWIGRDCRADLVIFDPGGRVATTLRSGRRVGAAPDEPYLPPEFRRLD